MLPGKDKAVVNENVRTLKKSGMSERQAVMASLKRSKKESKKGDAVASMPSDHADYPYASRLDLDHDMLEKLGIGKLKHGQKVQIHAKGHVHETSERTESDGKTNRRATVQMTHMKVC